jgi:hypothetical protein
MPRSSEEATLRSERGHNSAERQNEADGGESGEKGTQKREQPIGFWHKELKAVRLNIFKNWVITSTSHRLLEDTRLRPCIL